MTEDFSEEKKRSENTSTPELNRDGENSETGTGYKSLPDLEEEWKEEDSNKSNYNKPSKEEIKDMEEEVEYYNDTHPKTIGEKIRFNINEVKRNAKANLTPTGIMNMGANLYHKAGEAGKNATTKMAQDTGYLGNQIIWTGKNIGLSEKQSTKKYGDLQYPTLFGGAGGYADLVTSDKGTRRKIRQVGEDSNDTNKDMIADNQGQIRLGKKNPMDIFAKSKSNQTKKEKELQAKLDKLNGVNKGKKPKRQSLNSLGSIGLVSSPFGSEMVDTKPRESNGVISVDFNGLQPKQKNMSVKTINRKLSDNNPYNDPFGSFKQTKSKKLNSKSMDILGSLNKSNISNQKPKPLHNANAMQDIFSGGKKTKGNAMEDIFGVSHKKAKPLKGQAPKNNNVSDIFSMDLFGQKKKKRGLF